MELFSSFLSSGSSVSSLGPSGVFDWTRKEKNPQRFLFKEMHAAQLYIHLFLKCDL